MSDVLEKEEQQVAAPAAEPQEAPAGKENSSLKQKWANMPRKKRRRMIRRGIILLVLVVLAVIEALVTA